jgi:hypothetical protein
MTTRFFNASPEGSVKGLNRRSVSAGMGLSGAVGGAR